ncbi:hypothetical protein O3P69_016475 [Scylla paramamosain]|uniref:Glucose-methanol-choline oxidoreductase N-terminal domain-containing protein n=1 Tax=Scylla paramamosain TaxID=85552 RepID=A0AAW0TED5_SCYPA
MSSTVTFFPSTILLLLEEAALDAWWRRVSRRWRSGVFSCWRLEESRPWRPKYQGFLPISFVPGYNEDWGYRTTPQKYSSQNFANKAARQHQGRVLGGGSTVNAMYHVRGNRRDYDYWAALGNPGWDYNSVLPYFIKSEDYRGDLGETAAYHGRGGPIGVTPAPLTPLTKAYIQGGMELGYNYVDYNGPEQIGFSQATFNIRDGVRSSVVEEYLKPASSRPNLHILHGANVLQIVFEDKRATGVKFLYKGKVIEVGARREVILSAGSIASPKLLMLSGVGPRYHLQHHQIPVVVDLPGVGQNVHDHVEVLGLSWTTDERVSFSSLFDTFGPSSILQYKLSRKGLLGTAPLNFLNAWVKVRPEGDPMWPDIQVFFNSATFAYDKGTLNPALWGLDMRVTFLTHFSPLRRNITNTRAEIYGREGFTIRPIILRPKSRGTITLRSKNPDDYPVIDPQLLSHPEDVKTLVEGVKFALRLGNTSVFANTFKAKFFDKPLPDCAGEWYGSDAYWECFVRHMTTTFYHITGSCKMAPPSDPFGVVDHKLRVRGVAGLRVIDFSVLPAVVSGNSHAPTVMIAEKGSDLIKEDWSR